MAVAPETPPGTRAVYTDVAFIVLGEILARVAARPLDALFVERVAGPLALGACFHRLSTRVGPAPPGHSTCGLAGRARHRADRADAAARAGPGAGGA